MAKEKQAFPQTYPSGVKIPATELAARLTLPEVREHLAHGHGLGSVAVSAVVNAGDDAQGLAALEAFHGQLHHSH